MAFDGITVAGMTKELKDTLEGGRISKIAQPETDELLLTVKTPDGQKRLCISASASLPLIYLTSGNKPSPMTAPNFCMLLRKHISNGRIVSVNQPGLERIIRLEIEHLDELGDLCRKTLVVEIMGKHSNIIFCAEDGTILDSIKHVSAQMSSVREVLPGRPYFIPDTQKKLDPLNVQEEDFALELAAHTMPLGKALYSSFTGISPVAAEEVCWLAGLDSGISPKELSPDLLSHLYRQFCYYLEPVKKGEFSPAIYYDGEKPKEFSVLPLSHYGNCRREDCSSVSDMLYTFYASRDAQTRIRQKSTDLRHVVQTALERNRKKYDLQHRQLSDTRNREKFKVYGELLHTYGYSLEEGAKKLDALNYYTNEMVTIPLDPQKTAMENAASYFEKYNKQNFSYENLSLIDFNELKLSSKFTPAIFVEKDGVFEGGSVSMFSPVLKFTLSERFSNESLEVSETMEVNGKRTFGYDEPIIYKRID